MDRRLGAVVLAVMMCFALPGVAQAKARSKSSVASLKSITRQVDILQSQLKRTRADLNAAIAQIGDQNQKVDSLDVSVPESGGSLLGKLQAADGSGSGLDADMLDGLDSSAFAPAGAVAGANLLSTLLGFDGNGSGLDSDKLDGIDSSLLMQRQIVGGQTVSGQISAQYVPGLGSVVAGASFPAALPAGTGRPLLEVVNGTSVTCPGIGQATAGRLCVYRYNSDNINSVGYDANSNNENRRFGFSLSITPVVQADPGYLLANWAYTQ